ncbi:hypothetical protein JDV02_003443 [Purpureocillium takamizusanense]|uniref:Uncharacterized protein n=1 Tax=Purpureocillium takamizusanense TaxID=2060973 RepID=A0A9Q8QAL9_9HYPO|nr:uncharacterized protein JDV02_003443 [Purpureocillium takamizusanense]UNI17064.1 hypothetical protein JDV02_003443 [Purpureocillium takamizusanense]
MTSPSPSPRTTTPANVVVFGPGANCTLAICPVELSTYKYRPSLGANAVLLALFFVAMNIHVYLGLRWRTWWFMVFMMVGCGAEIIGYVGRILLYTNPFSYAGFLIQVIFITGGPAFYSAAIYILLSVTIEHLASDLSRIKPVFFYWMFIAADLVCIALQASGGALSTVSLGASQTGVKVALAGLALQVVVLFIFCLSFADYMIRYFLSSGSAGKRPITARMRVFFGFLSLAVLCILGRCSYRCYELSQGYRDSDVITNEGLFIGLEGVYV